MARRQPGRGQHVDSAGTIAAEHVFMWRGTDLNLIVVAFKYALHQRGTRRMKAQVDVTETDDRFHGFTSPADARLGHSPKSTFFRLQLRRRRPSQCVGAGAASIFTRNRL